MSGDDHGNLPRTIVSPASGLRDVFRDAWSRISFSSTPSTAIGSSRFVASWAQLRCAEKARGTLSKWRAGTCICGELHVVGTPTSLLEPRVEL